MNEGIFNRDFKENILRLTYASSFGQLIVVLATPILTRIYTPEGFGILALYVSFGGVAVVLATCRLEVAIMLPKKQAEADSITMTCFLLSICIAIVVTICVFCLNFWGGTFLHKDSSQEWLLLLPITCIFGGWAQVVGVWLNRVKKYRVLAASKLIQSFSTALIGMFLGYFLSLEIGLVVAFVSGGVITSAYLVWRSMTSGMPFFFPKDIVFPFRKYKNLFVYTLPNSILDNVRLVVVNVLFGVYFGNEKIGLYTLALKLIQLPSVLIGSSISHVLFEDISRRKRNQKSIFPQVKKYVKTALLVSFLLHAPIYFFAESVFLLVFGSLWEEAGKVAKILVPWMLFSFVSSPLSMIYMTMKMERSLFFLSLLYFLAPVSIIVLCNQSGYLSVLKYMSLGMVFVTITMIVTLLRSVYKYERSLNGVEGCNEV